MPVARVQAQPEKGIDRRLLSNQQGAEHLFEFCRRCRFQDIPQELLTLILQEVVHDEWSEVGGIAAAAKMRRVSKAWAAAFSDMVTDVEYREEPRMLTIIRLLPKTATLQYNSISDKHHEYLSALEGLKQLTRLELDGDAGYDWGEVSYPSHHPQLNFGCLPPSILDLNLHYVSISPDSTGHLQCKGIKYLYCKYVKEDQPEFAKLLANLTELEVSPACCSMSPFSTPLPTIEQKSPLW